MTWRLKAYIISTNNEFHQGQGISSRSRSCVIKKSLDETAKLNIFCVPSKITGETLKFISDGKPVSIQHPYEEFDKYKLGLPGILNL